MIEQLLKAQEDLSQDQEEAEDLIEAKIKSDIEAAIAAV